jgi:hypothetical protein
MTRTPVFAIAAILAIALASPFFADEMETIAFEKLSHAQRTTISTAGAAAIQGIVEARVSLESKDGAGARRALGGAAEQLRRIRDHSPSAGLSDSVSGLHTRLVKGEGGDPGDLAPIYTRLDAYQEVAGVGVAEEVRAPLNGAKGSLSAGQHEEAAALLVQASESIRYVEIDLPVKETLARVDRARTQVGSNDFLGADGNLREAQGSLQTFGEMASIQMGEEMEAVGSGPE